MRHDSIMPFGTRYGGKRMSIVWSEQHKRELWRRMWVGIARDDWRAGVITDEGLRDIVAHSTAVNIDSAVIEEGVTKHDVFAELAVFSRQCKIGGSKLHLGATSSDIVDNTDVIRVMESLGIVLVRMRILLKRLAALVLEHAYTLCEGRTHLQFAKYTTVGYRFAKHLQNLVDDYGHLHSVKGALRAKGWTGAIGTGPHRGFAEQFEMPLFEVTTQVYPRRQDFFVVCAAASLAGSLYNMALDIRLMQFNGTAREHFEEGQIGSSAMAHKRNPVFAENICSLGRYVSSQVQVAWGNFADNMLERTLDDSAARRIMFPSVFLSIDEMLIKAISVVGGLAIFPLEMTGIGTVKHNSEELEAACVLRGADRQTVHRELTKEFRAIAGEAQLHGTVTNEYVNQWINPAEAALILITPPDRESFDIVASRCRRVAEKANRLAG